MVKKRDDLRRPRVGRPPKELAGDAKARILDAAHANASVFFWPLVKRVGESKSLAAPRSTSARDAEIAGLVTTHETAPDFPTCGGQAR